MSKVAITGNASGTGTFTIAAPNSNTDRTLTLPDSAGEIITTGSTFAGTGPAFSAYQSGSAQIVSANTYTKITLNSEEFDTNSNFASSRFTPTVAGYYQINGSVATTTPLATSVYYLSIIAKNGGAYAETTTLGSPFNYFSAFVSTVVYLNGTTDYIELYGQSSAQFGIETGLNNTFLSGFLARAA